MEEGKIDANKDVSKEITNNEEKLIVEKPSDVKLEREYRLNGSTYCVKTPQGKAFITINKDSNGRPFEVFINVGKAGTDVSALSEGLGRLVSGWLRVPGASENAVTEIISQLGGIGGSRSVGFGKNKVSSIPDAVAKVLSEELGYSLLKNQSNGNGDNFISTKINTESLNIRSDASGVSLNPVTGNIDVCPDCGNYSFIKEEGCAKCYLCGYSIC